MCPGLIDRNFFYDPQEELKGVAWTKKSWLLF